MQAYTGANLGPNIFIFLMSSVFDADKQVLSGTHCFEVLRQSRIVLSYGHQCCIIGKGWISADLLFMQPTDDTGITKLIYHIGTSDGLSKIFFSFLKKTEA